MSRNRKAPEMTGIFAEAANDFVNYKRSLGFKYEGEPKCLARFCRFADEFGTDEIKITRSLAEAFTAPRENEAAKSRSHRLTCVRQFALYLDSLGYDAYILPEHKGLEHSSFVPYIFTHDEMKAVIRAVDETEPQTVARDMHRSLPVIFRILYGCGLRVSEVLKLQYRDVNLDDGILTIREAKTDRDRLIPLSDSVKAACVSYAENIWWERDTDLFFPAPDRTMISPMTIYQRFRRYLMKAGISHGGKGNGPRLHDIRHTFAVHVLQKWVAEGADLTAMMPILGVYMGHQGIRSTARYLRLTAEVYPELLRKVETYSAYVIPEVEHERN